MNLDSEDFGHVGELLKDASEIEKRCRVHRAMNASRWNGIRDGLVWGFAIGLIVGSLLVTFVPKWL